MVENRFIRIIQYQAFGELVRKWSNGTAPTPKTVRELKAQIPGGVAVVGDGFLPDDRINLIMLPPAAEQISLVILDKADLDMPVPPGGYPLPDFYSLQAFDSARPNVLEQDKFRSSRIADYCTGKCM